jgi:anti-sigma factor RsiW
MHSEIRARLSEYLERDLAIEERARIGAHLESCTDCDRELNELRETVSLLRRLPEPTLPAGISEAVMLRIARGEGREARVRTLFRRAAQPRFAAPLAAGLAGLFLLFQAPDTAVTPPRAPEPVAVADASALGVPAGFPDSIAASDEVWVGSRDSGTDSRTGVTSSVTPAAIYHQYVTQARMEEARGRARIQEYARQLRGAGHPNSESLASRFESRPNIVLADWPPR